MVIRDSLTLGAVGLAQYSVCRCHCRLVLRLVEVPSGDAWATQLRLARQFGWSARDGAAVARRAHNPKVGGSNPSPATKIRKRSRLSRGGFAVCRGRAMRLHAADVAADRSRYRSRGGRQGNSATCSPVCPCHKRVRHAIMLSLVVRARRTHPFSFRTRK